MRGQYLQNMRMGMVGIMVKILLDKGRKKCYHCSYVEYICISNTDFAMYII